MFQRQKIRVQYVSTYIIILDEIDYQLLVLVTATKSERILKSLHRWSCLDIQNNKTLHYIDYEQSTKTCQVLQLKSHKIFQMIRNPQNKRK